jgi:hypothetical protein
MKNSGRKSAVLVFCLALLGAGNFWATSSHAASFSQSYPAANLKFNCNVDFTNEKGVKIPPFLDVVTRPIGDPTPFSVQTGETYISNGFRTLRLDILSNGGHAFAEGIGATHFWFDSSRPLASALWEKSPGTWFPAFQEMRFHFFYTAEAFPGKIFRSVNPAIMRSNNVTAFPPPPGTTYQLVKPVDLEDVNNPGKVIGQITSNYAYIPTEG